jgi:hypothetical protein
LNQTWTAVHARLVQVAVWFIHNPDMKTAEFYFFSSRDAGLVQVAFWRNYEHDQIIKYFLASRSRFGGAVHSILFFLSSSLLCTKKNVPVYKQQNIFSCDLGPHSIPAEKKN